MKNVIRMHLLLFCSLYLITPRLLAAQDTPGKLSGKAYFEYFVPDEQVDDVEKFQFTRYYFQYDKKISDNFDVRYRLDADRKADPKFRPFMKHAYVSWADLIPKSKIYIGMQEIPNWAIPEKYWGYRSIDKTIIALHKLGSAADVGIGLKGKFTDRSGYHATLTNGTGFTKPENDDNKKFAGILWRKFQSKLIGTIFFDFEPTGSDFSNYTFALSSGYDSDFLRAGAEYFYHKIGGTVDKHVAGISVYGALKTQDGNIFARLDLSDPNDLIENDNITYFIFGYDYKADKNFHIMPNFRVRKVESSDSVNSFYVSTEFNF